MSHPLSIPGAVAEGMERGPGGEVHPSARCAMMPPGAPRCAPGTPQSVERGGRPACARIMNQAAAEGGRGDVLGLTAEGRREGGPLGEYIARQKAISLFRCLCLA